jgi:hypothetical protein
MTAHPSTARRSPWLRPAFLLAVGILSVSAVGLNVAVSALQLHFKKAPVYPARDLATIPKQLGPWVQVSIDEPLDHELQDTLGTDRYVFRDYVDTRRATAEELARFDGKDSAERKSIALELQRAKPDAVIDCAVTYYTGMVDTVAHIPERCYVADGYQPDTHESLSWDLGPAFAGNGGSHQLDVSFINFVDTTEAARVTKRVAYTFFVDGQWEPDSIGVRERLQDLRATHGFYSKIELMTVIPDHDRCAAVMTDFLSAAVPQVAACYPDWAAVERGTRAVPTGR